MKQLKFILVVICALIGISTWHGQAEAMKQSDLNNHVYIVTMINANAYRTEHQYAFFDQHGRATYVNVEDIDSHSNPVVDAHANKEEQAAPEKIRHLLNRPRYLNRQAKKNVFTIQHNNKMRINNGKLQPKPAGKLDDHANPHDFTVTYSDNAQKYTSVQFKLAPKAYQYHWIK